MYTEESGRAHFDGIVIDPTIRGGGVGKALFCTLCQYSKEHGSKFMTFFTGLENPARNIYLFAVQDYTIICDYEERIEIMSKVIMAIGAHIGDMELTVGGVLATEALKGAKIVTVALTAGERGNPKGVSQEDYRKQKVAEAKAFVDTLGPNKAIVFEYRDGELPNNEEVRNSSS